MERFRKLAEIGSNVAIVLIAIFLGYFLISRSLGSTAAPARQPGSQSEMIQPGSKLSISNIDWARSERNLLMVLSTTCRFCTESMPFYRRLVERNAAGKSLRVIAALPQDTEDSARYLTEHSVMVDELIKANPSETMVRGTPTLLLVNRDGVVLQTWAGKLPPEKEAEVLTRAFSEISGLTEQ